MNRYKFLIKNVMDKLRKIYSDHKLIDFYWEAYILSRIENIDPDIYVVSYPKCGRTWLRVLLKNYMKNIYSNSTSYYDKSLLRIPSGEIIKFHHDKGTWVPAPPKLERLTFDKKKYQNKKVVLLVRDPRDVLVSSWFHLKYRENIYTDTISEFIRDDLVGIKKIVKFMNMWSENRYIIDELLLITYEELHENVYLTFRKLLEFLNISIKDEFLISSIKESSFNQMKIVEKNSFSEEAWMKPGRKNDSKSMKIRKGKVGGYHNYFSKKDIEKIEQVIRKELSCYYSYH